mmetsp:Transcript_26767/g.80634  ORF Transcript_26767/g.80634 Transcript_26767/m.80634 type:complete len:223 (+) Transcript_26767:329-997(+)
MLALISAMTSSACALAFSASARRSAASLNLATASSMSVWISFSREDMDSLSSGARRYSRPAMRTMMLMMPVSGMSRLILKPPPSGILPKFSRPSSADAGRAAPSAAAPAAAALAALRSTWPSAQARAESRRRDSSRGPLLRALDVTTFCSASFRRRTRPQKQTWTGGLRFRHCAAKSVKAWTPEASTAGTNSKSRITVRVQGVASRCSSTASTMPAAVPKKM